MVIILKTSLGSVSGISVILSCAEGHTAIVVETHCSHSSPPLSCTSASPSEDTLQRRKKWTELLQEEISIQVRTFYENVLKLKKLFRNGSSSSHFCSDEREAGGGG